MAIRASGLEGGGDEGEGEALVRSFQAGDREAFAQIFRAHHQALIQQAERRLGSREWAEDAVQEAFVRALRGLPGFGASGEFRLGAWLSRIVSNVCHTQHAQSLAERRLVQRVEQQEQRTAVGDEPDGDPATGAVVQQALDALPPRQREAFLLRVIEGLDYPELARRTGVSEGNARARVHRARSSLKRNVRGTSFGSSVLAAILAGRAVLKRIPALRLFGDPATPTTAPAASVTLGQLATNPAVQLAGATSKVWLVGVAATVATVSGGGIATAIATAPATRASAATVRTAAAPPPASTITDLPAAAAPAVSTRTWTSPTAALGASPTRAAPLASSTVTALPTALYTAKTSPGTTLAGTTTLPPPRVSISPPTTAVPQSSDPTLSTPATTPPSSTPPDVSTTTSPAASPGAAGGWLLTALAGTPAATGSVAPAPCAWWPASTEIPTGDPGDVTPSAVAMSGAVMLSTTGPAYAFGDPTGAYRLPGAPAPISGTSLSAQFCLPPLAAHLQFTVTVPDYEQVTGFGTLVSTTGTPEDIGYLFRGTVDLPPAGTDLAGGITATFVAQVEVKEPANTAEIEVVFLTPTASGTPTTTTATTTTATTTTPTTSATSLAPTPDDATSTADGGGPSSTG